MSARREQLMFLLRAEGIRVVPVNRVANLETWPIADVLLTYVTHSTAWWIDVGAAHVVLLVDTDEERSHAERSGASSVVASGDTAALLSLLRNIAETTAPSGR
jgi:hypothetical protein